MKANKKALYMKYVLDNYCIQGENCQLQASFGPFIMTEKIELSAY